MKYKWEKYRALRSGKYFGICLSKDVINVSLGIMPFIPKRLFRIAFDKKNRAVMLEPSRKKGPQVFSLHQNKGSWVITCSMLKFMPKGRYMYQSKIKRGWVFVKRDE